MYACAEIPLGLYFILQLYNSIVTDKQCIILLLQINNRAFHDKEFLQIFYRFVQFICKSKVSI